MRSSMVCKQVIKLNSSKRSRRYLLNPYFFYWVLYLSISSSFAIEVQPPIFLSNQSMVSMTEITHPENSESMITHIVLVKFMREIPDAEIKQIFDQVRGLEQFIPGMLSFYAGKNDSPEGLGRGYSHSFVINFENGKARDAYLAHPEHIKLSKRILAACQNGVNDVLVFDIASAPED